MQELLEKEWKNELTTGDTQYLYLYTPLCGTCQVAGKMLTIVEQLLPDKKWLKADLNYVSSIAKQYEVESVPCLLVLENTEVVKKIYAFQSVTYLYDLLKTM